MSIKGKVFKMAPNILVMAKNEQSFQHIKSYLLRLLGKNSYTIYKLNETEIESTCIWMKNCALLVTVEENLENDVKNKKAIIDSYLKFLDNGGHILSLPEVQNH